RVTSASAMPDSARTSSIIGISRSAWPLPRSSDRDATILSLPASKMPAAQTGPDVSMTRIILAAARPDRFDFTHCRNEMVQQVLHAMLQRGGRRRAAGTGTLHVEEYRAVAIALEGDVAAVLGDGRTHAGIQQFLDGRHQAFVAGLEELA